jgi:hypothetical protein
MRDLKVPETREHYLTLLHMGDHLPSHLSPEQEAELPPQFRRGPAVRKAKTE